MVATSPQIHYDQDQSLLQCTGAWTINKVGGVFSLFTANTIPKKQSLNIDGTSITSFDSAGALTLIRCIKVLEQCGNQINLVGFSDNERSLLDLVASKKECFDHKPPVPIKHNVFYNIGEETIAKLKQVDGFIILIGDLSIQLFNALGFRSKMRAPSIISNIDSAGLKAMPILALLSFLIGVVLAYQMGLQLETYGANIFIAYLSGMAIFREFGPLITAIIVAGRTSSAFTAQIGSMKIHEEIDALLTMGLSPTALLVMPKVLGLLLIFPLLIFWSDVFSIIGSMIMSKVMLGIGYYDFLQRLRDSVGLQQLMLGLYKAPAFSLLIALVGCFQGFRVGYSADSVGSQTTKSVVQALFLIIIADAIYSVVYSWMDL